MSIVNIKISNCLKKRVRAINNKIKFMYILCILTYVINFVFNIYKYEYKYKTDDKNKKYNVMIIEKQKEYDSKIRYVGKIDNDKFILNIYTKNKYDSKKDFTESKLKKVRNYKYGDRLNISGKIVIPELLGNIGEFNYKRYLNSKEIVGSINVYNVNYVDNVGNKFTKLIHKLKQYVSLRIDNNLSHRQASLLKGMLYGDTNDLDDDIKQKFQNVGISHITAVSGSNLTIFLIIFTVFLDKSKLNNYLYTFIQISLILFFCFISNFELSVLRAGLMMIINIIARFKGKKISVEKNLILVLFVMILVNPYRIFNIGMILSFLATISISVFYPKVYNFLESKIYWNIKNKVIRKILLKISKLISITISANILILPVSISTFNTFSPIFVISNLFISTISTCVNILGFIAVMMPKIPIIFNLVFYILNICLKLLITISNILNTIDLSIQMREIPFIIITIYYIYIFLIYLLYKIKNDKRSLKVYIIKIKNNIICIFIISICIWSIYINIFDNYIYYFNVGQGEMAIIKKDNTVIMIDSGSITNDTSYIFDLFAKKQGINKIDILVISHFHSDHVNGVEKILKKYKVEYILYAYPYDFQNEEYLFFLKCMSKYNVKRLIAEVSDKINIGDICINVLSPEKNYIKAGSKVDENENANSLTVDIEMNKKHYLFLGDSVKESEKYILANLNRIKVSSIEVIKIAHHGSKTSTSDIFINTILPKYSVISSKKKVYNHPSKETLYTLDKYNVKTYITEKSGGIKFIII